MKRKYWVPSIERVDIILMLIANAPRQLKLMELSEKSNINKSSLFSILNTLEVLGWVEKEAENTYSLGAKLGFFSSKYIQQFDIIRAFDQEAEKTVKILKETIQLSILEKNEIIYLAKKEGFSRVRVASEPGMRFPAHATAMGKAMLSSFSRQELEENYKGTVLEKVTEYTVDNLDDLMKQIDQVKESNYIIETSEAVAGFTCIAAPIRNEYNEIIAAISFTIGSEVWEKKKEMCKQEILTLSNNLSINKYT